MKLIFDYIENRADLYVKADVKYLISFNYSMLFDISFKVNIF